MAAHPKSSVISGCSAISRSKKSPCSFLLAGFRGQKRSLPPWAEGMSQQRELHCTLAQTTYRLNQHNAVQYLWVAKKCKQRVLIKCVNNVNYTAQTFGKSIA
jgi:hypothetical protein